MSVDFNLREFCRPYDVWDLHRAFAKSQWYSPEQMHRHQAARMQRMLRHAYDKIPFYRQCFDQRRLRPDDIAGTDDLHLLPILNKDTLRQHGKQLQAPATIGGRCTWAQSSGTSGEPIRIAMDGRAQALEFVYYWRHWGWAGYALGQRFAEFSSAYFLADPGARQALYRFSRLTGRLIINSLSLSPAKVNGILPFLRRYRPRFLKGTPSVLQSLAWLLRGQDAVIPEVKAIFCTGEMLLPFQRRMIEQTFDAKVYDSYGHMERTVAISECPHGRLHINPDYGVLELLQEGEDRGPPEVEIGDATGSGAAWARIVGTSLHNRAMPLIRYDTGDWAQIDRSPAACSCGRSGMPVVRRILGRRNDVICTPDGALVPTLFIVFDDFPEVAAGQIVQSERSRLRIRIAAGRRWSDDVRRRLQASVHSFVGPDMRLDVEVVRMADWPPPARGKFRVVQSEIPDHPLRTPTHRPAAAAADLVPV